MYSSRYNYDPLATWGSYSTPPESAQQMHLDSELAAIPQNGVVVDIGAGVGLSLAASIFVRRPDLQITSVDPGFAFVETPELFVEGLDTTIEFFEPEQQSVLRASQSWRNNLVTALAEDLPLPDSSADAVVSYSCVPHYSLDREAALAATLRLLKIGGLALNGPMLDDDYAEWDEAICRAMEAGEITACSHWVETLETTYGMEVDAHFTRIVR